MDLNDKQRAVLLRPLNPSRVHQRTQAGRQFSYLEAWDVKAHLNRVFGICGWSAEVLSAELMFENMVPNKNGNDNWQAGYKVLMRMSVHSGGKSWPTGGAVYTEAAVGAAQLPSRGEAHDMAVKTAESDALKRCAVNLGDQFGLSLYKNGSLAPVVQVVLADGWEVEKDGPQDDTASDRADDSGESEAERQDVRSADDSGQASEVGMVGIQP